jgi:membrane dipeptidase
VIVDAHLDIAFNAIAEGRGFEGAPSPGYALSRDALTAAGVGLVFPTIFVAPDRPAFTDTGPWTYRTAREASLMAHAQVSYYRSIGLPLIRTASELKRYRRSWRPGRLAGVLLMESADPIAAPSDLRQWLDLGVRVIGPAWSRTRYTGGTGAPGGLTALGRELLAKMAAAGVILDLTHMADRAVDEALAAYRGPIIATHAGARAIRPGQRQLTDAVVQ